MRRSLRQEWLEKATLKLGRGAKCNKVARLRIDKKDAKKTLHRQVLIIRMRHLDSNRGLNRYFKKQTRITCVGACSL
jgi:hypothetical protein